MSTQEATSQQPLLQAIDLKKHYPVKKGMFAPERLVKALDGILEAQLGHLFIEGAAVDAQLVRRLFHAVAHLGQIGVAEFLDVDANGQILRQRRAGTGS